MTDVAYSPQRNEIAAAGGGVWVWQAHTGELVRQLCDEDEDVWEVEYLAGGKHAEPARESIRRLFSVHGCPCSGTRTARKPSGSSKVIPCSAQYGLEGATFRRR